MCKVHMIRLEPGLIAIPVEGAVYCKGCGTVSNSAWARCGLCGSGKILDLSTLLIGPIEPDPSPLAMAPSCCRLAA
jgi:hypothetical protein